jgi:hypothetical protein
MKAINKIAILIRISGMPKNAPINVVDKRKPIRKVIPAPINQFILMLKKVMLLYLNVVGG